MASGGGPSNIAMTVMQSGGGVAYHIIQMPTLPVPVTTTPPTCWERLQCCMFGLKDNMDLIQAVIKGKREDCERILQRGTSNINTQDKRTKQTALHIAACHGNEELVDLLLNYKAKINVQDSHGNTPLHLAIKNGHCSCSKRILECASKKINLPNKANITPLHLTVKKDYKEIACELLKKSTENIDLPDNAQQTALHIAAHQGKEDFIDLLLNQHAKCNKQDKHGNTPLHLAIKNDHCSCSKKILEWNNININLANKELETSLHIAVSQDYKDLVEKRLEKSMTPNTSPQNKKNKETALHNDIAKDYKDIIEKLLEKSTVEIDAQNKENKDTALHIATRMKKNDIVDLLLKYNANCNAQNSRGNTALHLALKHNPACAARILQCDNLQIDLITEDSKTPLYLAVKKYNMVIAKKLLEKGAANIDVQENKTKQTALHAAANCGKEEFVEILLRYNAKCNIQDGQGNTPLHLAIKNGHNTCCEKILGGNTADINLVNENQESPLHLAVKRDCVTIANKLLDMELDYNAADSSGSTALHLLAEYGYLDCCAKLLKKDGVNINAKTNAGDTPLHRATQAGKPHIVALLQNYPGDCNSQNSSKDTPLHLAVYGGHLNCVTELLKFNNLMINSTNKDNSTALHCAVKNGNPDIVSELLLHHADCNAKDSLGNTPLHCAVIKGDVACCEKLLECSDLKINELNISQEAALHVAARLGRHTVCDLILKHSGTTTDIKDKMKRTPLHLATAENNHEVIQLLLSKGADWKVRDKHSQMPLHYAAEKGYVKSCEYLVNAFEESEKYHSFKLKNRRTPLILAAMGGYHHCCEILPLSDIDLQDNFGKTALIYAIEQDYENTFSFLLNNNARTDIKVLSKKAKVKQTETDHKEKKGQQTQKEHETILHLAVERRANKCLKCLLEHPNTKDLHSKADKDGHTPLHEAINSEALECAKILLSHGASPTATTNTGMTPLHLAAKKGDPGICYLLLSSGVKINAENNDQETPLHLAAKHGCLDACRVLMTRGIRKLARDKSGRTPLHLAAENGHAQVVQFLVKKGGHLYEKDDKDSTPLHLAAAEGHLQVCQILVHNATHLVKTMNNEEKLPIDVAFENQKDDVFAFLISKLKPEAENDGFPHTAKKKNMEKRKRFHKYMHQALKPQDQNTPREAAAEGILASEWWTAAIFIEEEEKDHNSDTEDENEYSDNPERSPYCTNFHDMINKHPNLALKTLDLCHASPSSKSDHNPDFRLFEDNLCSEAGVRHSGRPHAPMAGQRLLQDHPVSLMMKKEECPGLLQHPLTDSWLMHFWRTSVFYIFMFLLVVEVLYLVSLHLFMDNVDNWEQIHHKCNTTQEQFCRLSSSPGKAEEALDTDTSQDGSLLSMMKAQVDGNFRCSQRMSLWQWIFVVVMTVSIGFLEVIRVCRLRMDYINWKRLLRIIQLILTFLSWLPMGMCGLQHSVSYAWQWHCGIISLLLEWILVIGMLNQLPVLFVFMPITRQFFFGYIKALFYITSLLFAFSYVFQLLLDDQDAFESRPKAMIKMIVWLLGDLNYDSTFVENLPFHPAMTKLMFVVFIIIMGGFIANLAVTLPSERLDEFRKDAKFYQKMTQSTLLMELQACFPWFQQKNLKNEPDKSESWIKILVNRTLQKIFTADIIEETNKPQDNPLKDLEQQVATLVNICQEQGREMKELRQQFNVLTKQLAEKDLKKSSS